MQAQIDLLKNHSDPEVQAAAKLIDEGHMRRKRIIEMVQESLSQLRLDMKYLIYDIECTRRERDVALKGGA